MFIKRNKSRPSLRARDTDEETSAGSPLARSSFTADDGDEPMDQEVEEGGSVMERKKAKGKEKRGGGKPSRLSFGVDAEEGGEGTPFKPRKSLLSQSIKLPSTPPVALTTTPSTTGSTYSRDYLKELKASTPSRAPQTTTVEDEDDDEPGLSRIARDKYANTLMEDTTAGIPDAAAVVNAKMKRSAAVESTKHDLGDDYISLGGGQIAVYDGEKGPHPESRLMREEDEEGEGDEELAEYTEANDRLHLGKTANKAAARRMRGEMGEMIADREAEDEDDEEAREWEEAQARRAGGWEAEQPEKPVKRGYLPAPIPASRPLPTIGPAQARLAKSIADLRLTQTESEHNLEVAAQELAALETRERELRKEVETVEGKREWIEEFQGWVETLGRFLEEKFPRLEDVEADAMHHLKERAELVGKRRATDDSDDLAMFLGAPKPSEGEEVDDVGRSRNAEAGPSSAVRRARRSERDTRRIRRRARTNRSSDEDGFSTDSTLAEGDDEDYSAAQKRLEHRVIALLDDVKAEDFRDPEKGLAVRFGDWRRRYEEEYVNAFGGLAMVQAWEFWARGEMVGWEPLRGSNPLESFRWFIALHHYSRPKPASSGNQADEMDMDDDEAPLGPEGDLVPEMVSKAVVPLLIKAFEAGAYDPYSAPQTRRAVDLADVVQELTGKDSRKFTTLLRAVLGVFHAHLLELTSPVSSCLLHDAIPPPAFDPSSRTSMERFVRRRIKLLRNMLLWRREASLEIKELINRLVGEVIRPAVSRTWGGGGREMAGKVLEVMGNELRPDLAAFLRDGPGRGW